MKQTTRKYIVINIPFKDKVTYAYKSKELLEVLKSNGIDISNILILPDDVKLQYLELPIVDNEKIS